MSTLVSELLILFLFKIPAYGQPGSGKPHLMDTAYSADRVTGVTLWTIKYIFYS
jgi:hypothetical protein